MWLLSSALLVFCVAGMGYRRFLTVNKTMVHADAIAVLGGEHRAKLPAVAACYREGYAPRILLADDGVFSAWSDKHNRNLYQVEWAEEELVALGVPRQAITRLPFEKSGTYYDILAVKRYVLRNGIKRIILITTDYHTRRTYWTARWLLRSCDVAIGIFPVPSWSLSPRDLAREYLKFFLYPIRYGLIEEFTD